MGLSDATIAYEPSSAVQYKGAAVSCIQACSVSTNPSGYAPNFMQLRCWLANQISTVNMKTLQLSAALFYKWKLFQASWRPQKKNRPCLLDRVVSWSEVLSRERWPCCGYRMTKIKRVIVHASWPKLADSIAFIVCAHGLILQIQRPDQTQQIQTYKIIITMLPKNKL